MGSSSHFLFIPLISICLPYISHSLQYNTPSQPSLPALIIFGDSTVDAGNNNHLLTTIKSDFPPYGRDFDTKRPTGRFSNGRLVTDFIASMVGVPFPLPYLDPQAKGDRIVGGINFASSASGFYDNTATHFNVASLSKQMQWFKQFKITLEGEIGAVNATNILTNAVYIISTGTNDLVNNYYINPRLRYEYTVTRYNNFLTGLITEFLQNLYHEGARKIAALSIPPIGCLPAQISLYGLFKLGCIEWLNEAAVDANVKLQLAVGMLKWTLPEVKLAYLDSYNLLLDASKNPQKYGFSVSRRGCCGTGRFEVAIGCNPFTIGTCLNASTHVFWDSFHPSHAMNDLLAQSLFQQGESQLFS